MLQFDEHGHLASDEIEEISLADFKQFSVDGFPESITRKVLYDNYLAWILAFQTEVFPYFEQWIDGSFVTQKRDPRDLDFVTFLDADVFELREKALLPFWSFSNEAKGLDAYIVKKVPLGHPDFSEFSRQKTEWKDLFMKNKSKPFNTVISKGFVKINFSKI